MKKILIFLLVLLLLTILIIVSVGGYYGFVPGVSAIFGSDKPKDLGVSYTESEFNTYNRKANFTLNEDTSGKLNEEGVVFSGQTEVKDNFTKEEVSARVNYSSWVYMPINNVQINFPSDNTIEFSANLLVDRLAGFINAVGLQVSNEDIDEGLKYLKITSNPTIYARAKVEVNDNIPSIHLDNLQVGRFNIPFENYDADSILESATRTIFASVPGFYAKSVSITPNGMMFEGTLPTNAVVEVNR